MPNTSKQQQVEELQQILDQYKHFIVISFEKTPHKDMEELRKELYKVGATMRVVKNSLFQKTIEQRAQKDPAYQTMFETVFPMSGSSAMIGFPEEWIESLKGYDTKTKKADSINYRFGMIDQTVYQEAGLKQLADLPSREQLMATLLGTMKAPLSKTTFSLKFPMQRFVTVLHERAKQE